ncbi:homeobox protein H2.0-like [Condylostylus longicornis]|uniref:homeobox protein H2.0-like n=1 Tax=Condylostylus longicornis TaxID=2530218 RepID=UPI00244DC90B|nr:homeobox protein H2.0-like [Condylostylus longicornis]
MATAASSSSPLSGITNTLATTGTTTLITKDHDNNNKFINDLKYIVRPTPIRISNNIGDNNINQHHQNGGIATSSNNNNSKRKRSWSRAVFSNLQRKGLEIQFQQQKYITKPDRRKLANRLNLTDAQVKVWFQNRRMKWRHTQENLKSGQEKQVENFKCNLRRIEDTNNRTSSDEDEDEIDVVAE